MTVWASQVVLVVENTPTNAGDMRDEGSIPGLGKSPEGGHSNPFQCSGLENPRGRRAWWPIVHGCPPKSVTVPVSLSRSSSFIQSFNTGVLWPQSSTPFSSSFCSHFISPSARDLMNIYMPVMPTFSILGHNTELQSYKVNWEIHILLEYLLGVANLIHSKQKTFHV